MQADDLHQVTALIGGHRADAHLRHGLEHALLECVAVLRHGFARPEFRLRGDAFGGRICQPRAQRGRAEGQQRRRLVRVAHFAGVDHEASARAKAFAIERLGDHAGDEQSGQRCALAIDVSIRQHQDDHAAANGRDRVTRQLFERRSERERAPGNVVGHRQGQRGTLRLRVQRVELAERQDRRFAHHHAAIERRFVEQAAAPAKHRAQRHHRLFAQRIDRRIGDLRESLAEEVGQQPPPRAQHRQRACRRPSIRSLPCHLRPSGRRINSISSEVYPNAR